MLTTIATSVIGDRQTRSEKDGSTSVLPASPGASYETVCASYPATPIDTSTSRFGFSVEL